VTRPLSRSDSCSSTEFSLALLTTFVESRAPPLRHSSSHKSGLSSGERAELVAARRRIRELEAELAIHRRAAELLKGTTSPKGGSRPST
jgi:hypothetical protein